MGQEVQQAKCGKSFTRPRTFILSMDSKLQRTWLVESLLSLAMICFST